MQGTGTEVAVAAFPGLYWRSEYRLAAYRAADLQFSFNGVSDAGVLSHESKKRADDYDLASFEVSLTTSSVT